MFLCLPNSSIVFVHYKGVCVCPRIGGWESKLFLTETILGRTACKPHEMGKNELLGTSLLDSVCSKTMTNEALNFTPCANQLQEIVAAAFQ